MLATHDMSEAEIVCDRVTLIDRGKVIATESPRTLGQLISRFQRIDADDVPEPLVAELRALAGVTSVEAVDGVGTRIEEGVTQVVLERLVAAGVSSVRTSMPSLEEVYVQLIGERGMEL